MDITCITCDLHVIHVPVFYSGYAKGLTTRMMPEYWIRSAVAFVVALAGCWGYVHYKKRPYLAMIPQEDEEMDCEMLDVAE